ncbi:MAG: Gfo/Idh/MocA family oxidoreductase [Microbacteriaceae bacterium]|nr:Gfo/Idh/MocA family oxidoreductase [Microbacteriaceae bacterium]
MRVGLIGCGSIAADHVRGYLALAAGSGRLVAVADADPVRRADVSKLAGGVREYGDYTELLADSEIDAVDICLPHHLHRDAILAAAASGKHILAEKPLCLTAEEADEIGNAVTAAGVTLMCAHNQLFMPTVRRARELVDEGFCGDVHTVRTSDSFFVDFTPETMGWRANRLKSGGGELIDTGYHPAYLLLHLAGSEPTAVTAILSRYRLGFLDGEDSAQVSVRFGNGALGTLETSWAHDPAGTEKFALVGAEGALWGDGTTLWTRRRGQETHVEEFEPVDTFAAEIDHFVDSVRTGTRPVETHVEGTRVLEVILGAYRSSAEGRTVDLDELHPAGLGAGKGVDS